MTTKRSGKSCKVPTVRKPTRRMYHAAFFACIRSDFWKLVSRLFRRRRSRTATKDEPLPPPHDWPEYNGECWQQAYQEMLALQTLAYAYQAYVAAQGNPYMPPQYLAQYATAYNTAKIVYLSALGAMDDCLNTTV